MLAASAKIGADQRGAVFVEQLVVFIPVLFFIMATMQLVELYTGALVLRRAASAAARAAIVVLPDNPEYYGGQDVDAATGRRMAEVRSAAAQVLRANSHFRSPDAVSVGIEGNSGNSRLTATVRANFSCLASFVSIVCGGASRELRATATYVYHGARYAYE